ncbi:MAG: hypothetical protein WCO00_07275 [Rhodospirillaceae bacterium]
MIQIVPGVSAPSAPVMTVLRTRKVSPLPPQNQPEDLDEPVTVPSPSAPAAPAKPPPPPAPTSGPTPLRP